MFEIDLLLRLRRGSQRANNQTMTDWIKSAAETVKSKYEQVERDREKQRLDARAIEAGGLLLWKTLRNALNAAVKEFNAEFKGHSLGEPIQIDFLDRNDVLMSTCHNRTGQASVKLRISLVPERNTIECLLEDRDVRVGQPKPPELYIRVSDGGTVQLALQPFGASMKLEAVEIDVAVRKLTEPIFLACVRPTQV